MSRSAPETIYQQAVTQAYLRGAKECDCPHPSGPDRKEWLAGCRAGMAMRERQDAAKEGKECSPSQ